MQCQAKVLRQGSQFCVDGFRSIKRGAVALLVQGYKIKGMAHVGTTERVIKNYLRNIYDKIGGSDRLEVACLRFDTYGSAGVCWSSGFFSDVPVFKCDN
jgi:hypothetical protein